MASGYRFLANFCKNATNFKQTKAKMFKVTLVRHGETDFNKTGNVQGQLDEPLNDTGRSQALSLARCISEEKFTHIFSSDLVRASETCKLALSMNSCYQKRNNEVQIKLDPILRERCYGCLEGKSLSEYIKAASSSGVDFMWFTPDGGESRPDLYARTETFFLKLCKEIHSFKGNDEGDKTILANILVVAHGAYLRAMCEVLRDKHGCTFAQDIKPNMFNAARTTLKVTLPPPENDGVVFNGNDEVTSGDDWIRGITIKCTSFNIPVKL